jgi:Serine incorporator (Serinc)
VDLLSIECVRNKNAVIVYTGVAFLHFFLLCSMFCKSEKVKIINEGLWIIKILVAALISLFLRFMVGTTFFQYIEYLSVWTANVFYLFVAIVFVDLAYAFDGYLDECAQENGKIYILKAIISITLLLTSSFICFLSFKHNDIVVCWVNAASLLVFLIFALLRLFPGNSILVAGLISLCINIIGFYIES